MGKIRRNLPTESLNPDFELKKIRKKKKMKILEKEGKQRQEEAPLQAKMSQIIRVPWAPPLSSPEPEDKCEFPQVRKLRKNKKLNKRKERRPAKTFQIVPWAFSSEWENVSVMFNQENWAVVLHEIKIWKERAPALPIGVESTLFLVQSIIHDDRNNPSVSPEESRSIYALAIIRFLNHVSHLATKELGASVMPMFKLAKHIDIPEWIVNLRHECTHGTSLPSLEILRIAARFITSWLKDNYWVCRTQNLTGETTQKKGKVNILNVENSEILDSALAQKIRRIISAFIAARIYKLQQKASIKDKQILILLPGQNNGKSMKTKSALIQLKRKFMNYLSSDCDLCCTVLAQEMIPNNDFFQDFSTIFNRSNPFQKFALVLNPITKLLHKKGSMVIICRKLADIHTMENSSADSRQLSAQWLNLLLTKIQDQSSHDTSTLNELKTLVPTLLKSPNTFTNLFLDKLFAILEKKIGSDNVNKLKILASIWSEEDLSDFNLSKYKRMTGALPRGEFYTHEHIVKSTQASVVDLDAIEPASASEQVNQRDSRGPDFWRKIPLGSWM